MDIPWKNLMSNIEHLCRNAQSCIRTSSPASRQWCGESLPCLFGNPALMVWPPHTHRVWPCQARQKYSCTVRSIIGLQHYIICMFKFFINTILSNAICIYTICIYTVCIFCIHLIRWIHIIIVIMLSLFGIVKVANSHVHLWTCTDVPWVAQRRSVHSSPVLLAAPFSMEIAAVELAE